MLDTLYQGSVKDILGPAKTESRGKKVDSVVFRFTDAYSVFDWGRMPDLIPYKGQSLALMAAHFFEKMQKPAAWAEFSKSVEAKNLRQATMGESFAAKLNQVGEQLQKDGMDHHYLGVTSSMNSKSTNIAPLGESSTATNSLTVKQVKIPDIQADSVAGKSLHSYDRVATTAPPRLIPLEVIFRFTCPPGSSLIKRAQKNPSYLSGLPVTKKVAKEGVVPGAQWDFPVMELTTKLEKEDRILAFQEAFVMSGLTHQQFEEMMFKTAWLAAFLKSEFRTIGIDLADGKLEWALDENGKVMLVDAIGPDELRLLVNGVQLSKEFLRIQYRNSPWAESVGRAKEQARFRGLEDWKKLVTTQPEQLPEATVQLASQMYCSLAQALSGKTWFGEVESLEKIAERIKELNSG